MEALFLPLPPQKIKATRLGSKIIYHFREVDSLSLIFKLPVFFPTYLSFLPTHVSLCMLSFFRIGIALKFHIKLFERP